MLIFIKSYVKTGIYISKLEISSETIIDNCLLIYDDTLDFTIFNALWQTEHNINKWLMNFEHFYPQKLTQWPDYLCNTNYMVLKTMLE